MKSEYVFLMFALCFAVWVIVVDNLIIPDADQLRIKRGQYSRYRVKEWKGDGKWDLVKDKILIYAHSNHSEKFYYIDHTPYFAASLNNLEPGQEITVHYAQAFPKIWQRTVYEVQSGGLPVLRYSGLQLKAKQEFIWKFTGIIGGIFALLLLLGTIAKPKNKRKR